MKIDLRERVLVGLIIGSITVVLDLFFHGFFTSPFELPAYFLAKFIFGFIAGMLVPELGGLWAAVLFSVVFVDGYYGIGVYWLMIPGLSASPNGVISIVGYTNQIALVIIWTIAHGLFFYAGYLVARALEIVD